VRFRPALESLEDRTLPSAYPFLPPASGPATHLQVITPASVDAGNPAPVEVIALDASNHPAFSYTGTVHFTSSDGTATLPADYAFTAQDHGVHFFQTTLMKTGSQSVTATDTATATITGSASTTVDPALVATHLLVVVPFSVRSGVAAPVEVIALDASNGLALNYTGTVHFTSSDKSATPPADYTFTAQDHGVHFFQTTLTTTGTQSLTATDTTTATITGSASTTVNPAPLATHLLVIAPANVQPGVAASVEVIALDASNHLAFNYTGTVHFTGSDGAAMLPADYTFTSGDDGFHTFSVTWQNVGSQTITATDTTTAAVTGTATVQVATDTSAGQALPATHLLVITPTAVQGGVPAPVEVIALDASNHLASGYTGTVHFTSTDNNATLPADYTFTARDHGLHFFRMTLTASGSQSVTATDTTTATITGSATTTVDPAPVATHLLVIVPRHVQAGSPVPVEVVALDATNHLAFNYTGTVHFTSSDGAATLPANYTFTTQDYGFHFFQVTLTATGSQSITATDTATATVTGSASTMVNPAVVATHLLVIVPPSVQPGVAASVEVIALDASNHLAFNYTGTVHFTGSDGAAMLPADYTFTSSDEGFHAFSVTWQTVGSQTITATDTKTATVTGTATVQVSTIAAFGQLLVIQAGQTFQGTVATFSDANSAASAADYTVQITWGDGNTSAGQVTQNSDGSFTVSGTNTYAQTGTYTVTVQIAGTGGSSATVLSTAYVVPNQLNSVAGSLTHSFEFYDDFIFGAYRRYLGRNPALSEIFAWAAQMQRGLSEESVEAGFIGSWEYITNHGGPGAGWVTGLYQDLLGRTPAGYEVADWVQSLANGASPQAVAFGFAASAEREGERVAADYLKYLGRAASPTEVAGWVNHFLQGYSNETLIASFVGSWEYFHDHGGTARTWLGAAYGDVLGRPADQLAYDSWLPHLG
jgi:hypothetical protein